VDFDATWIPDCAETHDVIAIPRRLCLGPPAGKHLSGGATTAALAARAVRVSGKALAAINVQFLAPLPVGRQIVLSDTIVRDGRSFAYVDTMISLGDRVAARAQAICGGREGISAILSAVPSVPSPQQCLPMPWIRCDAGDQQSALDIRLAESPATSSDGGGRFWFGVADGLDPLSALAIAADYLPEMLHMRLGQRVGAISLDNQLQVFCLTATDWILCDVGIEAIADGRFVGRVHLFDENGMILATGGQSGLVIAMEPPHASNSTSQ
jgi:acyl-CoA thioesterase II